MRVRYVCSQNRVRGRAVVAPTLRFRSSCYLADADFSVGPRVSWTD
jgi:hypothetical protein